MMVRFEGASDAVGFSTRSPHPITCHQLRHTFATEMIRLGVSLPALMQLLGHKNIHMTMRYVKVTQSDVQRFSSVPDTVWFWVLEISTVWTAASCVAPLYSRVARFGSVMPLGMFFWETIFPDRRNSSISAQVSFCSAAQAGHLRRAHANTSDRGSR